MLLMRIDGGCGWKSLRQVEFDEEDFEGRGNRLDPESWAAISAEELTHQPPRFCEDAG
jgi:hypothetical protein